MTHIIIQGPHHTEADDGLGNPLEIVVEDGRTKLRRDFDGRKVTFTLNADLHFKPWSVGSIYYSAWGEFHYVSDLAENRDKDAFMRSQFACREGVLVEVGWGATAAECALVSFTSTLYEGDDAQTFPRNDRTAGFVNEVIPGFAEKRLRYTNARRELLKRISPLDSIGELEKQVDLLTGLVLHLAKKLPDADRPDWLPEFESAIDATSSIAGKAPGETIEAIKTTKGATRAALKNYHLSKTK